MRRFNVASVPGRLLLAVLAVACLTGAWHLMATGLNQLAQARQMERMPQTPVAALVKGPYAISGQVKTGRENLTTPYSASSAVYVRYRLQEEYRDADGERRTRTLEAGEQGEVAERSEVRDAARGAAGADGPHPRSRRTRHPLPARG